MGISSVTREIGHLRLFSLLTILRVLGTLLIDDLRLLYFFLLTSLLGSFRVGNICLISKRGALVIICPTSLNRTLAVLPRWVRYAYFGADAPIVGFRQSLREVPYVFGKLDCVEEH